VVAVQPFPDEPSSEPSGEQRLIIHGVSWGQYTVMRDLLDDHAGLRMTYLEGTLELTNARRR
jgi:hypothetical protein